MKLKLYAQDFLDFLELKPVTRQKYTSENPLLIPLFTLCAILRDCLGCGWNFLDPIRRNNLLS